MKRETGLENETKNKWRIEMSVNKEIEYKFVNEISGTVIKNEKGAKSVEQIKMKSSAK